MEGHRTMTFLWRPTDFLANGIEDGTNLLSKWFTLLRPWSQQDTGLSDIASSSGQGNCAPDFPANSTSSLAGSAKDQRKLPVMVESARDQSKLPTMEILQKDDEKSNDRDSVSDRTFKIYILDEMEKGNNFKIQKAISVEPSEVTPLEAISSGSHGATLEYSPTLGDCNGPNPYPNIEMPIDTNSESGNGYCGPPKPTDKLDLNHKSQRVAFLPNTEAQPEASSSRRPRKKSMAAILNVTPYIYWRRKKIHHNTHDCPKDKGDTNGENERSKVNDSQFLNMNRIICTQEVAISPTKIWSFLQQVGLVQKCTEEVVISKIKELESRDAQLYVETIGCSDTCFDKEINNTS
ncbi:hypothetical protein Ancab_021408 [Ancistrocladus abbreviatus]